MPPAVPPETPEELAAQIDADMAELLASPPPPAPAGSRKERFAALLQQADPAAGITAGDLAAQCGLGRTWTHQQLSALLDRAAITRITTGRYPAYAAVPGQDVWAALLEVWDATDRISEFARVKVSA